MTHTYVELELSAAAYDEIAGKLRAASYHVRSDDGAIDMHGIGVTKGDAPQFFQNKDGDMDFGPVAADETSPASKQVPPRNALWDYFQEQHGLALLESELDEIERLAKRIPDEPTPASKEKVAPCIHGHVADLCRLCLKAELARTESARVAILAENTHYKQRVAELQLELDSARTAVDGWRQLRTTDEPSDGHESLRGKCTCPNMTSTWDCPICGPKIGAVPAENGERASAETSDGK